MRTIWVSNVCFTGVLVNVLNNDIYIEKSISCTAAVNFLTAKGFKLWEKTFQHIINQLLNFKILEFWALHLPQLTRNCSKLSLNKILWRLGLFMVFKEKFILSRLWIAPIRIQSFIIYYRFLVKKIPPNLVHLKKIRKPFIKEKGTRSGFPLSQVTSTITQKSQFWAVSFHELFQWKHFRLFSISCLNLSKGCK